jgi:hypothetical protein
MFLSAVEVPDVNAIINTRLPHPVVTSVEGRQWLSLPHTTIQIQGTPLISLLDSGSEVTCINEENFIALKARDTIHTLPVSISRLVGATGQQSSRIKWQGLLEFTISGLTFTNIFLVVKNLIRPVVIGIDWLNQVNAVLDFEQSTLSVAVQGERRTIPFHADAFVSEVALPVTSVGRMPLSELAPPFDLSTTITPLSGLCEKAESVTTLSREQRDQLYRVLASHHVVFNGLPGRMHKYAHEIKMHDQTPFVKRVYPIAFSLRPQVEKTIRNMERTGVIKRESSPFASPITVVKKKDGTVRVCLDATWVNQQMVADCEAPRPPEDVLHSFQSIRYISAIDLRSSYWQIPLSPSSTPYTAFLFNGQSYTYQVLPFGLKTAVGAFSRAMDVVLGPEVREYTINYIDDLLIVSSSFEEHLVHLFQVLQRLQDAGMTVNLEKSVFPQCV